MKDILPFDFTGGWDQQDTAALSFYDTEFTRDFGPIKKGDKFSSAYINYDKGIFEVYDGTGEMVLHRVNFVLQAI